jgi:hypothetical protein
LHTSVPRQASLSGVFVWQGNKAHRRLRTGILSTTVVMYWTAFFYHFLLASEISMLGTSIPLVMEFAKPTACIRCCSA